MSVVMYRGTMIRVTLIVPSHAPAHLSNLTELNWHRKFLVPTTVIWQQSFCLLLFISILAAPFVWLDFAVNHNFRYNLPIILQHINYTFNNWLRDGHFTRSFFGWWFESSEEGSRRTFMKTEKWTSKQILLDGSLKMCRIGLKDWRFLLKFINSNRD